MVLTLVFVLIAVAVEASASDDPSLYLTEIRLTGDNGHKDLCFEHDGVTRCKVKFGQQVDFQAMLKFDGGIGYVGVNSLDLTLQLVHRKRNIVKEARTCPITGGHLVINGKCGVNVFASGSFPINPYSIRIPTFTNRVTTSLIVFAKVVFSDKTKMNKHKLGEIVLLMS